MYGFDRVRHIPARQGVKMIYLDASSTTQPLPEAIDAMMKYLTDEFYNPSSVYEQGVKIHAKIEMARSFFKKSINAQLSEEILFTSCGSEGDNWALRGMYDACRNLSIITSAIEHHAVLNCAKALHEIFGVQIIILDVNSKGIVETKALENALLSIPNNRTILVSVMMLNNEIGTIQNIKELAQITHEHYGYFMTDAVQSFGKMKIDVQDLNVDILTTSSHKLHAPRGSGFLYVRKGVPLKPLIYGGQQENHRRGGTENVASIMAFKAAAEIALGNMERNTKRLWGLHDYFTEQLDKFTNAVILNRSMPHYPGIVSVDCGVPAERMVAFLDQFGICVSSGSACNSREGEPSHVLKALGLSDEEAGRVVRFSFSADVTEEQLSYAAEVVRKGVEVLKA